MNTFCDFMNQFIMNVASYTFAVCIYGFVLYILAKVIISVICKAYQVLKDDWKSWRNRKS